MRLEGLPWAERAEIIISLIQKHGTNLLNAFTVVSKKTVRFRPHSSA
jgi:hypothetical protein